jgi:hypothetical protein
MGPITNYLKETIEKQVNDKGLVIWFDPDGFYKEFVSQLKINDCEVVIHSDGYYKLRYDIREKMKLEKPPRMVIYLQIDQEKTENALIEFTTFGTVLKPAQIPWQKNTRPSVVARNSLKDQMDKISLEEICTQVDGGNITLSEIENSLQSGGQGALSLIRVIYGTLVPSDISLIFLSSDDLDEEVIKRDALEQLKSILTGAFGIQTNDIKDIVSLRERFASSLFMADLRLSIPTTPTGFPPLTIPDNAIHKKACIDLVHTWRNRRDLSMSYAEYASRFEQRIDLSRVSFTPEDLSISETLSSLDLRLLELVEICLSKGVSQQIGNLIEQRRKTFWPSILPELGFRWELCQYAGRIALLRDHIKKEIGKQSMDSMKLLTNYVEGDRPWFEIDGAQRAFERMIYKIDLDKYPTTKKLVIETRKAYRDVANVMCDKMTETLKTGNRVPMEKSQRSIFKNFVQSGLANTKTAYILVDALRYEMAVEMARNFESDFEWQLSWAVGSLPSVTEIGMVAVLPGAEERMGIQDTGNGTIAASINGQVLSSRTKRIGYVKDRLKGAVAFEMEDILSEKKRASSLVPKDCKFALVTSREIDDIGETNNHLIINQGFEPILGQVVKAVFKLARMGFTRIVVTADHGFLLVPNLGDEMKMDEPQGKSAVIHIRAWVGYGGRPSAGNFLIKLSELGYESELDLILPKGLGLFRVPGGEITYFHGGPSPQEMTVPILNLTPKGMLKPTEKFRDSWILTPQSTRITTTFFSVTISGKSSSFDVNSRLISLELRDKEKVVSSIVSAGGNSFDKSSGFFSIKTKEGTMDFVPTTVLLMFDSTTKTKSVSLVLTDVTTQTELKRIEDIEVTVLSGLI